ncbi:MAG: hypothetical protein Q7U58_08315, partial [Hydrogenophaga sp.]|nr:hypothetical protein [Hydrogenophaga sp.]
MALRLGQGLLQTVGKQGTVGQTGQDVEMGDVFELLLMLCAIRDVVADPEHAHQAAVRGPHRYPGGLQQDAAAVTGIGDPFLVAGGSVGRYRSVVVSAKGIGQIRRHKIVVGFANDLAFSRTKEKFDGGIAREIPALRIFQPDQIGNG